MSVSKADYVHFTSTPYTVSTKRAAATLGAGQFLFQTVVDGRIVSSSEFDVTS